MKTELEIRMILREQTSQEKKADAICKIMTWNREKLIEVMRKHGCSNEGRNKIIGEFWKGSGGRRR